MYEILGIYIKILDDVGFQFYLNGLIWKLLEATGTEHCNGYPIYTKVRTYLGIYENGPKANIYLPNSYASIIGMIKYLE